MKRNGVKLSAWRGFFVDQRRSNVNPSRVRCQGRASRITLAIFSSGSSVKAISFTWSWTWEDPDLYVARASMTRSVDSLFGGSTVIAIDILKKTKVRSTMYAARYIAVDTLEKKNRYWQFLCKVLFVHSPFLIFAAEDLKCNHWHSNYCF